MTKTRIAALAAVGIVTFVVLSVRDIMRMLASDSDSRWD